MGNWPHPGLLAVTITLLLGLGLTPDRIANRSPRFLGRLTMLLTGLVLLISLATAVRVGVSGPVEAVFHRWTTPVPLSLGVHLDAVAVVMMVLVSFLGLAISRFSISYLLGDLHQGRFFRWMSFTIGATLLLVISRNLVMLTAAWMMTSLGLHKLLTHYPERSWAIWAARKKFLVSRLGDLMLIAALILTYRVFGTTEYDEIFAAIRGGLAQDSTWTALISVLLVLGAMTKSAQFPFHSWLPDTMETPTPVSALMHAGVINAGGFLVIRLSPLVSLSGWALDLLAMVGAVTALLGGLVMLTQTSIKRGLAYSTISQMGFMMLQCGLGAFSAALLHIVAHSAYKAHAFLSSGSVLDAAARFGSQEARATIGRSAFALGAGLVVATGLILGTFWAVQIDLVTKPGGLVLGLILMLGLTQFLGRGWTTGVGRPSLRILGQAWIVTVAYAMAYLAIDRFVAGSIAHPIHQPRAFGLMVPVLVAIGFIGLFAVQALAEPLARHRWAQALHIHVMNGFYLDIPARRLTAWIYGQRAPVQ